MVKNNQSQRLTNQHKDSQGVVGIFGENAKQHDISVGKISRHVLEYLKKRVSPVIFQI